MSAKTTYTCNLCGKVIDRTKNPATNREYGFALRWITNYKGDTSNESLEMTSDWANCPFHLCCECIDAVADFRDELKRGDD